MLVPCKRQRRQRDAKRGPSNARDAASFFTAPSACAQAASGRARLDMFKKSAKNNTSAASLGGGQAVHFDWEQRDFTQTIQLGMTQLTAFLNEFGVFAT